MAEWRRRGREGIDRQRRGVESLARSQSALPKIKPSPLLLLRFFRPLSLSRDPRRLGKSFSLPLDRKKMSFSHQYSPFAISQPPGRIASKMDDRDGTMHPEEAVTKGLGRRMPSWHAMGAQVVKGSKAKNTEDEAQTNQKARSGNENALQRDPAKPSSAPFPR